MDISFRLSIAKILLFFEFRWFGAELWAAFFLLAPGLGVNSKHSNVGNMLNLTIQILENVVPLPIEFGLAFGGDDAAACNLDIVTRSATRQQAGDYYENPIRFFHAKHGIIYLGTPPLQHKSERD